MAENKPYYLLGSQEVLQALDSNLESGLTSADAAKRLETHGKNTIVLKKKNAALMAFLKQFKDILVFVLLGASIISFVFQEYNTAIVILAIVLINSVIGFIQEFHAERIISKLGSLINPKTIVLRDGKQMESESALLAPGDIVILNEGDSVTADLRLLKSNRLQVNSFSITGESNPAQKNEKQLNRPLELARQTNMIFTGSTVAVGNGVAVVVATGMNSEFGKIAALSHQTEEGTSPLQDEINHLATRATYFSLAVGAMMLISGYILMEMNTLEAVIFALGMATSMVPEGLPAEVNVALALGAKRLAEENAVVRRLSSVETLGATTFICSDKTGTLTKNEMTVEKIWIPDQFFDVSGLGYDGIGEINPTNCRSLSEKAKKVLEHFLECGFYSSNARIGEPNKDHPDYYVIGDPTEGAIISLMKKGGIEMKNIDKTHKEIAELPFDSDRKMMSSVREFKNEILAFSKGAPREVLEKCTMVRLMDGSEKNLDQETREKAIKVFTDYSNQAYRVLVFGYKKISKFPEYTVPNTESELVFMGLIAIIDPPRSGVQEAINAAHNAHIKTIIITGDSPETAMAIARKIHLNEEIHQSILAMTGQVLDHVNNQALGELLKKHESAVFSRVSPEQKLRIVGLLKEMGEIVAVTGDGVNDAPALKKAHIGIAMGKMGTEVAKEAAEIVLADDSFVTLVTAIREGRVIYANLKKTIISCFTSNFGEFFAVTLGLVGLNFGFLPPIYAVQILLVDLVGEILPLMALTYDKPTSDVMTDKPRNVKAHVLSRGVISDIILSGLFMGGFGYLSFMIFLKFFAEVPMEILNDDHVVYREATTITYITIVMCQFMNIITRRQDKKTLFTRYFFTNWFLWISFGISLILISIIAYWPSIHPFTKTAPVRIEGWYLILTSMVAYLLFAEIKKFVQRKFAKNSNSADKNLLSISG